MALATSYEPADIIIHVQGKGIVLKEKSLIAFRKSDNKILASGTEAEQYMGQNPGLAPGDIVVMSPLRQGMVVDYLAAVGLFSQLFIRALGKRPILKPAVAVCVPRGITAVEKYTIEEVLARAGAREVLVGDIPAEEFIREFPQKFPKLYGRYKITIGITKDEPKRYIEERLRDVLAYAAQEQVPPQELRQLSLILSQSAPCGPQTQTHIS